MDHLLVVILLFSQPRTELFYLRPTLKSLVFVLLQRPQLYLEIDLHGLFDLDMITNLSFEFLSLGFQHSIVRLLDQVIRRDSDEILQQVQYQQTIVHLVLDLPGEQVFQISKVKSLGKHHLEGVNNLHVEPGTFYCIVSKMRSMVACLRLELSLLWLSAASLIV